MTRLALALCILAMLAPRARADKDIVIEVPGERSLDNKLVIGGVAGAGFIAGAIGLYFHLDSRSASNEVSSDTFTNHAWTAEDMALVDRADRSRGRAIIGYSVGGALIAGAIVAFILTEPKSEVTIIHPHGSGTPSVTPTEGGALLGGTWSF